MGVAVTKTEGRRNGEGKLFYSLLRGRRAGQRLATRIFSHVNPKDKVHRNHNKLALAIAIRQAWTLLSDLAGHPLNNQGESKGPLVTS